MSVAVYYDEVTGKVSRVDRSAHTPQAIADGALVNPDLSALAGVPQQRWRVVGSDVIDDEVLPPLVDYKATRTASLEREYETWLDTQFTPNVRMVLLSAYSNAVGKGPRRASRKAHIEPALDWIEAATLHFGAAEAAVALAVDHAGVDAVTVDWADWLSSNPKPAVTVASALMTPDD